MNFVLTSPIPTAYPHGCTTPVIVVIYPALFLLLPWYHHGTRDYLARDSSFRQRLLGSGPGLGLQPAQLAAWYRTRRMPDAWARIEPAP